MNVGSFQFVFWPAWHGWHFGRKSLPFNFSKIYFQTTFWIGTLEIRRFR